MTWVGCYSLIKGIILSSTNVSLLQAFSFCLFLVYRYCLKGSLVFWLAWLKNSVLKSAVFFITYLFLSCSIFSLKIIITIVTRKFKKTFATNCKLWNCWNTISIDTRFSHISRGKLVRVIWNIAWRHIPSTCFSVNEVLYWYIQDINKYTNDTTRIRFGPVWLVNLNT